MADYRITGPSSGDIPNSPDQLAAQAFEQLLDGAGYSKILEKWGVPTFSGRLVKRVTQSILNVGLFSTGISVTLPRYLLPWDLDILPFPVEVAQVIANELGVSVEDINIVDTQASFADWEKFGYDFSQMQFNINNVDWDFITRRFLQPAAIDSETGEQAILILLSNITFPQIRDIWGIISTAYKRRYGGGGRVRGALRSKEQMPPLIVVGYEGGFVANQAYKEEIKKQIAEQLKRELLFEPEWAEILKELYGKSTATVGEDTRWDKVASLLQKARTNVGMPWDAVVKMVWPSDVRGNWGYVDFLSNVFPYNTRIEIKSIIKD